ncbi:MAG TPA: hypothetical protein EYP61_05465 [Candidatus Latescibacteria bacterium]|nr:hypothetical protein [Candidatus Latescibacterota bacterium]
MIRAFPAVPDYWHDAYFSGLRAEGAFLVTSRLKDGKVAFVEVGSEAGGECQVRNPFDGPAELLDLVSGESKTLEGEVLRFGTTAGGRYLIKPEGATLGEEDMSPPDFGEGHWFGVKRRARF